MRNEIDSACGTPGTTHLRTTVSPPPPLLSGAAVDVKVLKALDERPRGPAPRPTRRGGYQELVETVDTTVQVVTRTVGGAGRRKEKEWSGEWNRTDMEEVMRALRALKS